MKITISVTVIHGGERTADQLVTAYVGAPAPDTRLDPWFDAQLAPHVLANTSAVPGDEVIADVRECEGGILPVGVRFTATV